MKPAYKRILLKLSGEALMGDDAYGVNRETIDRIVSEVKEVVGLGVEVGIVIGGGNIFRGMAPRRRYGPGDGGLHGNAGQVITLWRYGLDAQAWAQEPGTSGDHIEQVANPYPRHACVIGEGRVVIFAAGPAPVFTTDRRRRARQEMNVDIVGEGTKVDGVYTDDPKTHPDAMRYQRVSFDEAIIKKLKVMDATALTLCRDQKLPICVFSIFKAGALKRVVLGEDEGTLVHA